MIASPPFLIKSRNWLKAAERSHYYAPRFATRVGIHLRTLQRQFRKERGCTITDWLNSLRLRRALVLARRRMPVTQIARELYFKSIPTFAREFKRAHNLTVTEFRENIRRKRKRSHRN